MEVSKELAKLVAKIFGEDSEEFGGCFLKSVNFKCMAGLSRSKVPKIPRQSKIPKTTVPVILFSAKVALAIRAAWPSKKST